MNIQDYLQTANTSSESWLSRFSDLFLAAVVVSIIALMLLPMPVLVLDVLVAFNIVFGVVLVLMGIYISSPLQFSVFPSVLLLSTLYRLALSVATTRMILLHGDAGNIIDTFGNMVAGGNIVVGLVVFLIITLVQFIVIAKGAERVAEVAARFSLDAMPGKQLSIDSDLRSGLISKDEAKAKRREVELESKLHGSMDGAMKFVKGDAIAGIVIILINLLGGLAIGVMQLDMDMGAAMQKYSILTVGDGMVAQIPALLGAMSAGLIVTRTTDDQADKHLGDSIQKQFSAIPRVSLVAGVLCFLMALVPGFPSVVFVVLGVALSVSGALLVPAWRAYFQRFSQPTFEAVLKSKESPSPKVRATSQAEVSSAVPLLLELPERWSNDSDSLVETLEIMLEEYQVELGLQLPELNLFWREGDDNGWKLLAYEVPIYSSDTPLSEEAIVALPEQVRQALRRHIILFLGLQETSSLLNRASAEYPDIIKEVMRVLPIPSLAAIFRNLVEEEIPIRNLRGILEALVEAGQNEKDVNNLTEYARIALRRQISYRVAPQGELPAVTLAPGLEKKLLESIRQSGGNSQISMDPSEMELIVNSIVSSVSRYEPVAIVAAVQIRRHIRKMIEKPCFDTPVVSHNELMPTVRVNVVSRVDLPGAKKLEAVS
jgi:type III secretion protein V